MSVGSPFFTRTAALNRQARLGRLGRLPRRGDVRRRARHRVQRRSARRPRSIDVSPLYKYLVSGPDASRLVDRVITRDAGRLEVGQVVYTPWCDERGKVIDDGTVTRLDETTLSLDGRRSLLSLARHERRRAGRDRRATSASSRARWPCRARPRAACWRLPPARTGAASPTSGGGRPTIAGVDVDVTRTGYTGDLGYELWIPAAGARDGLGRAVRRRRTVRHPPGRHPGARRVTGRGGADPDRGRLHQRRATR